MGVLLSWIGVTDFNAYRAGCTAATTTATARNGGHSAALSTGKGPLFSVAQQTRPERIELLWDTGSEKLPFGESQKFSNWLIEQLQLEGLTSTIHVHSCSGPSGCVVDFSWVYAQVGRVWQSVETETNVSVNASSGTPVMHACWIVFKKSHGIDLKVWQSSIEGGVQEMRLPPNLQIDISELFSARQESKLLDRYLRGEFSLPDVQFQELAEHSMEMKEAYLAASLVARFREIPVLLLGPPGSGKSTIAKLIHKWSGLPAEKYLEVDCGTLTDERSLGDLFGWRRGAFTGAEKDNDGLLQTADGGTVFLDEIGNAPQIVQRNLLRLLQAGRYRPLGAEAERSIKVRVLSATNADLENEMKNGRFRQDLVDRLSGYIVRLPQLSKCRDGIVPLSRSLLKTFNKQHESTIIASKGVLKKLSRRAEQELQRYEWPGNIRQLQSVIARLVINTLSPEPEISDGNVRAEISRFGLNTGEDLLNEPIGNGFVLEHLVEKLRQHYARRAMLEVEREQGRENVSEAARRLGITRKQLQPILDSLNK